MTPREDDTTATPPHGDTLGDRDEIRRTALRDLLHEVDDAPFSRAIVPGRERIGGIGARSCETEQNNCQYYAGGTELPFHTLFLLYRVTS
jgi:hypothetical protein